MTRELNIELGNRIAWLRKNRGLEQKAVASNIGIAYSTYQHYEYGYNPRKKYLDRIVDYYGCNRSWLFTGEGEPFPDAGQNGKDVSVTSAHPVTAKDAPLSSTVPATPFTNEFRISEALQMTARVLESGTSYATALYLNIQHFDRAITAEERIAHLEQNQAELKAASTSFEHQMQSIILEMREQIDSLKNENAAMKEEIKALRKENEYLKEKLSKSPGCLTGTDGAEAR